MKISRNVDLFLYDLKIMDPEKHRLYTGVSNRQVLENLELLDSLGKRIIIRFPLIPYINSDEDNIRTMCEYISGLRNVKEIAILPHHKLGIEKAQRINRETKIFEKLPNETLHHSLKLIEGFGFKARIN